jgi:hypothetical protein
MLANRELGHRVSNAADLQVELPWDSWRLRLVRGWAMTRPGRYPQELRERAVRLVFEHQDEHPWQWAAICSIAHNFGVSSETLP